MSAINSEIFEREIQRYKNLNCGIVLEFESRIIDSNTTYFFVNGNIPLEFADILHSKKMN